MRDVQQIEEKQKELNDVMMTISTKLYQQQAASTPPPTGDGGNATPPPFEEVK